MSGFGANYTINVRFGFNYPINVRFGDNYPINVSETTEILYEFISYFLLLIHV